MSDEILFVLTNHDRLGHTAGRTGWNSVEVSHPLALLRKAGYRVSFASPEGGKAPMAPESESYDDAINAAFLLDPQLQRACTETLPAESIDPDRYRAIFFVGGHGAMWDFPRNLQLARIAAEIYENGGLVAAIGHGAAALLNARQSDESHLVTGHRLTAFSNEEEKALELDDVVPFLLETRLRERGALYEKGDPGQPHVVCDGRLITGQNTASAQRLGEALMRNLTPD